MKNKPHTFSHGKLLDFLALIAGIALTFAFSPFKFSIIAIISIAILFTAWNNSSPSRALWRGLLFGLGLFGSGVSWVYISISTYGNTNVAIAILATSLFIFVLALFPAILGYLQLKLFPKRNNARLLFIFPASWVLFEFLRGWIFTGFPWLFLGYTQTNNILSSYATIGGVYLVSLICALISSLLIIFFNSSSNIQRILAPCIIALIVAGAYLLHKHQWTKKIGNPVQVSLIQGNISQANKWDPEYAEKILTDYYKLTEENPAPLIFWPENSIPIFSYQIKNYIDTVTKLAKKNNSAILIGMPLLNQDKSKYYNGAIVVGYGHGSYRKHHLVPFGEYLPLKWLIGPALQFMEIPMSSFSAGKPQQPLLRMNKIKVALFICYEIAYPNQVRLQSKYSELIAVISDDAWFGNSLGPWQHLQIAQMRAIENSRYLIQSTNDGVSAIVNQYGAIIKEAPQFKKFALKGEVILLNGSTPWQRYGEYPLLMLLVLFIFVGILYKRSFTNRYHKK